MNTHSIDLSTRLESLKQRAETARTEKAKAEATLESLEKQKADLVAEIKGYGIEPEQLDAEIKRLETEITHALAEAEKLLPTVGSSNTPLPVGQVS